MKLKMALKPKENWCQRPIGSNIKEHYSLTPIF